MKSIRIGMLALAVPLLVFSFGCVSGKKGPALSLTENNLTQEEAQLRASQVSEVAYKLKFQFVKANKSYSGQSQISFVWHQNSKPLRIDFFKGKVKNLNVNGKTLAPNYNQLFVSVPAKHLVAGTNTVTIDFERSFSANGDGLYRFEDPEDSKVYIYSNLEPFNANKVFPNFDQPDLKANYSMTVKAPSNWTVISSVRESKVEKGANSISTWRFPESARFSTYIWSLHAGPYHKWESRAGKIKLRLFVRPTLKKYVRTEDWFTFTKQGFRFFESYFDYPYPYKKYDQIIVPHFNPGAMENVAAVTFNERLLSRGDRSQNSRRRLANIILHEMAHMWFGNLVTMKWWNGLWLNESFASYMAALASAEATEFGSKAWRDFNGTKTWAYETDQRVTTHPIEANVTDTKTAMTNFDGITYGKGASWLKQTAYYLGPDNFKKGVQQYFKKYAEKNTEIEDFVSSLATASNKDLSVWSEQWLKTAGVNTLETKIQCMDNRVASLWFEQTAPQDHPTLRSQKTNVAFLKNKGKGMVLNKAFPVTFSSGITPAGGVIGQACPDLIFANYQDHAYVKLKLDQKTTQALHSGLGQVRDPFLRQQLWRSLWNMVRDGDLNVKTFAQIAQSELKSETDPVLLAQILRSIAGRYSTAPSVLFYWPKFSPAEEKEFLSYLMPLERLTWNRLLKAKAKSESQKVLFNGFNAMAETSWALDKVYGLYSKRLRLKGFKLDQDKRWALLRTLARNNYVGVADLIESERLKDPSDFGKTSYVSVKASLPDATQKQMFETAVFAQTTDYSFAQMRSIMYSLYPRNQQQFREQFAPKYFDGLDQLVKNKDSRFLRSYLNLAPDLCNRGSLDKISGYLKKTKNLPPGVYRGLRELRQEGQRCLKIRAQARSTNTPT